MRRGVLSLEPKSHRDVFDKAQAALENCAVGDGTYRLERGREEAVWPTALVLFVQGVLGEKAGREAWAGREGGRAEVTSREAVAARRANA